MSWTCPDCHRTFKNTRQWHSCVTFQLSNLFAGKDPSLLNVFEHLEKGIKTIGDMQISPVKSAIIFSAKSTFLAVKPKKNWLDLEFILDYEADEFPVFKIIRAGKSRYVHFIRISTPENIDRQLMDWIRQAYALNLKNA